MKRLIVFLLFVCYAVVSSAQDLHYSQFYNSPLNSNPANTGIFNGDKRINLSYRNQWESRVPWTTFSGSFDTKFYPKASNSKNFFSGGILFNYDTQSRISNLNLFNINVTGSYTYALNTQNLLTGGLMLGYANRAFESRTLTRDNQWNGQRFDPNLPPEVFDVRSTSFFESGLGVNYRWQRSRRTKVDLGLGIYHLFEPNVSFSANDNIDLPRRFALSGVGSFEVTKTLDIQLQALAQFQGDYREVVFGGLGKIYINQNRGKELQLHVGGGYRTSKSIFPIIALQFKNYYISANYDIDRSDFAGTPSSLELHFRYIITNVKPFKKLKVCPIF